MSAILYQCPHCLTENPVFGTQRCNSCQLTMMSDQEYDVLQNKLRPEVEQLQKWLDSEPLPLKKIQPLVDSWTPYRSVFPFLEPIIQESRQAIEPVILADYQRRKRLFIHLVILLVLLIAPMLSSLWQAPLYLTGLFMLPVLGWFVMGIWPIWRGKQ